MRTVEVSVTMTVAASSFENVIMRVIAAITRRFRVRAIHADMIAHDQVFARFMVVMDESCDFDVVNDHNSLESVIMEASLHAVTKMEMMAHAN